MNDRGTKTFYVGCEDLQEEEKEEEDWVKDP